MKINNLFAVFSPSVICSGLFLLGFFVCGSAYAITPVIEKPVFACGTGGSDSIQGSAGVFNDGDTNGSVESFSRDDYTVFESGPVRPVALAPSADLLFVANTPANCLEIYSIEDADGSGNDYDQLRLVSSVRVGIEPVSVAALSDTEVWVVNHVSDSVSIVSWDSSTHPGVIKTLMVGDEPRDIVFGDGLGEGAGDPSESVNNKSHAFITAAYRGQHHPDFYDDTESEHIQDPLFEEGIGRADIWVFDVDDYDNDGTPNSSDTSDEFGGVAETIINVFTNTPRALEVTPDGETIFVAGFMTGNQTTITPLFSMEEEKKFLGDDRTDENIIAPVSGLIVKWDPVDEKWYDETMFDSSGSNDSDIDWSDEVSLSLPDKDVFEIDVSDIDNSGSYTQTGYSAGVGTHLFNMVYNSSDDELYVSNIDARNVNRFVKDDYELKGHFVEHNITSIDLSGSSPYSNSMYHLNDHIDFAQGTGTATDSFSQPVNMVLSSDDETLYMASFGTGNIGVIPVANLGDVNMNGYFSRIDLDENDAGQSDSVDGGGPSGLALGYSDERLFVYTRFDNTIAVYDVSGTPSRLDAVEMFNPEPEEVIDGRPFLYDSHLTSSNGTVACGGCHIYGDMDLLAWDLGDPVGDIAQIVVGSNGIPFSSTHSDSFGNTNILGADYSTSKSLGDVVQVGSLGDGSTDVVEAIMSSADFGDAWENNSNIINSRHTTPGTPIKSIDGIILIDGTDGPNCVAVGCLNSSKDTDTVGFETLLEENDENFSKVDWGSFSVNDTFCQDGSTPSGDPLICTDGRLGYTIKKSSDDTGSTLSANNQEAFLARDYTGHDIKEKTSGGFTSLTAIPVADARAVWDAFSLESGVNVCFDFQQTTSNTIDVAPGEKCEDDSLPYHVYNLLKGYGTNITETGFTPLDGQGHVSLRLNEWWGMYHFVGSTIFLDGNPVDSSFGFANFHSMKGPKTTQSLRGIADSGALHWRGDKTGCVSTDCNGTDIGGGVLKGQEWHAFKEFNEAFVNLLGRSAQLSTPDMESYADFAMQLTYPPNPIRNLDNTLTTGSTGSNQTLGLDLYEQAAVLFTTSDTCDTCHTQPNQDGNSSTLDDNNLFGTDKTLTFESDQQFIKVPHLRNMYQKVGMFGINGFPLIGDTGDQIAGFGYLNEGIFDTLVSFFRFIFDEKSGNSVGNDNGVIDESEAVNIAEFVMAFPNNIAPVVGQQVTLRPEHFSGDWLGSDSVFNDDVEAQFELLLAAAESGECDLVKTDVVEGASYTFVYKDTDNLANCDLTWAKYYGGGPYDEDTCFYHQDLSEGSFSDGATKHMISKSQIQEATFTCLPPGDNDRFDTLEVLRGDTTLPAYLDSITESSYSSGSYDGDKAFDGDSSTVTSKWEGSSSVSFPEWIQFNFASTGQDIREFRFKRQASSEDVTNYPEDVQVWASKTSNWADKELVGEYTFDEPSEGNWDAWRDIRGGVYKTIRFEIHSVYEGGQNQTDQRPVVVEIELRRKES